MMFRYTACFCEENIWWLCQAERFSAASSNVVFISNPSRCCALYAQKAAADTNAPVFWDYHVVLLVEDAGRREVWDLDCVAGTPLPAHVWLDATFEPAKHLPAVVQPLFRLVPASVFVANFSSDRSHMRNQKGEPQMPFPSWPSIVQGTSNLFRFVDMENPFLGEVFQLPEVKQRWSPQRDV